MSEVKQSVNEQADGASGAIVPLGATHIGWTSCGAKEYYKQKEIQYLNHVEEEWLTRYEWFYWDLKTQKWEPVGCGFSPRRLKELES